MCIARININAFMNASLRARQRAYSMTIDEIMHDMSMIGKIANFANNIKLGLTADGMKFPAHFACRQGITCDACRAMMASLDPNDFDSKSKEYNDGYCYAMKGRQGNYSVQVNYWKQYRMVTECPEFYANNLACQMKASSITSGSQYGRFLDSGDVFTDEIYEMVLPNVSAKCRDMCFMWYTKNYERLNRAIDNDRIDFDNMLPIISSDKGVNVHDDITVNPNHLPISIVVDDATNESEIHNALPKYVEDYIICDCSIKRNAGCDESSCGHKCWKLSFNTAVVFGKH